MLSSLVISVIAFTCIFCGTLLGMFLRPLLPEHHLSNDAREIVKLATGTIATLAALVLGLLIASAKGTFDTMTSELRQTGSKIILLDRVMAAYGPETVEARGLLRYAVASTIERVWSEEKSAIVIPKSLERGAGLEALQEKIRQLSPRNNDQRVLQSQALQISGEIAAARWLIIEQFGQSSFPMPFFVVLVFWLAIIFASFGLLAPRNTTVITILIICVLSVGGSIFLMLELDRPYEGIIKISSAPLRSALEHLGQ